MSTAVPEKILAIIDEIHAEGNASLTRSTVLKKWFERRSRLPIRGTAPSTTLHEPCYFAASGFQTFPKPNPSKSFTLAVANSVTPKARRARAVRVS